MQDTIIYCKNKGKSKLIHNSLHIYIFVKHILCYRATNSENGEINKVKNLLTEEYGAVPATGRYYKVKHYHLKINYSIDKKKRILKRNH